MAIDPYSACPCGSGKKFKWCCQPIHEEIEKAFRQQENGQHEAALVTMAEVVAAHPSSPEALGRQAQLLHMNGRPEEAEQALEKAFSINPEYAYGYVLQGIFRHQEGEAVGAAHLFRRAVELYSADAREQLTFIFENLGELELNRNHPLAARYALQRLVQLHPEEPNAQKVMDTIFGAESRIPEVGRQNYQLQGREPKRPTAWIDALSLADRGKLAAAQSKFEDLAAAPKADPLAWYNLALLRAWQGENKMALDALDKYIETERDEAKAVAAAALAEILRLGDEMVETADYKVHRHLIQFRNGDAVTNLLQDWEQAGRLIGVRVDQEQGYLTGLVLEQVQSIIGVAAATYAPLAGHLFIGGDVLSVWHSNPDMVATLANEIKEKLAAVVAQMRVAVGPANFGDVTLEAMLFPMYGQVVGEMTERLQERAQQFFEETWIHRPLHALAENTPIDAAGHPILRRKLLGTIEFLSQCFAGGIPRRGKEPAFGYDFDRLRHRLGIDTPAPALPGPTIDFSSLSAADLAGLDRDELTLDQLDKAYRSAVNLDAGDLAAQFIQVLLARPADPARPDLFPYVKFLVDQAQTRLNWDDALKWVDEGLRLDAERNEARRRNDYELRRGQLFAKKGAVDQAFHVFHELVERVPGEMKYRGSAAEAMLSHRQGARARQFAEAGLEEARKQNNRDMEAYFLELVAAAKKHG